MVIDMRRHVMAFAMQYDETRLLEDRIAALVFDAEIFWPFFPVKVALVGDRGAFER